MLRLDLLFGGAARDVYALAVNERCAARDCICDLQTRSQARVYRMLERLAEYGQVGREQHLVRRLEGSVFELKEHESSTRKPAGKAAYQTEIDKVKRLHQMCIDEGVLD
jgi:predicted transcriptional regulator